MTNDGFWEIVAASKFGLDPSAPETSDLQAVRLRQLLAGMPAEEVEAFSRHFDARMGEAYSRSREGLWAVAFDIGGGCSDDMFDDFRSWLISMGREVYEAAIKDPDSVYAVAEQHHLGEDVFFEEFQYVPSQVLRMLSGIEE